MPTRGGSLPILECLKRPQEGTLPLRRAAAYTTPTSDWLRWLTSHRSPGELQRWGACLPQEPTLCRGSLGRLAGQKCGSQFGAAWPASRVWWRRSRACQSCRSHPPLPSAPGATIFTRSAGEWRRTWPVSEGGRACAEAPAARQPPPGIAQRWNSSPQFSPRPPAGPLLVLAPPRCRPPLLSPRRPACAGTWLRAPQT